MGLQFIYLQLSALSETHAYYCKRLLEILLYQHLGLSISTKIIGTRLIYINVL
jgi:hypothetical protein